MDAIEELKRTRLMVLARGVPKDVLVKGVAAIADAGVTVFESTFDHRREDCIAENVEKIAALVTNESVKFEDGYLVIGDKPGLGIDVNVEEIEKRPYKPRNLRHYTGTLTDIRPRGDTFYYFDGLDCEHPVF